MRCQRSDLPGCPGLPSPPRDRSSRSLSCRQRPCRGCAGKQTTCVRWCWAGAVLNFLGAARVYKTSPRFNAQATWRHIPPLHRAVTGRFVVKQNHNDASGSCCVHRWAWAAGLYAEAFCLLIFFVYVRVRLCLCARAGWQSRQQVEEETAELIRKFFLFSF